MKLKIAPSNFIELVKKQYSLDNIYMLKMIDEGIDLEEACTGSARFNSLYTSLERKGLVSGGKVTMIGKELIVFTESESADKIVKRKPATGEFAMWWAAYRSTDDIFLSDKTGNDKDKEVIFSGTRGLKVRKDECRLKFDKILIEGDYTSEDLIRALLYEIHMKIKKSIETGQNKLSFMQNSLTYLNQRTFENFIDISKNVEIKQEKLSYGFDI